MLDATKVIAGIHSIAQPWSSLRQSTNLDAIPLNGVSGSSRSDGLIPLPLGDNHRFEVLALGHLGLDVGNYILEIWLVLSNC